jgi:predicted acyl esterase
MSSRVLWVSVALALALPAAAEAKIDAHGSARQVYVRGAEPGAKVTLKNAAGKVVRTRKANELGGALFRGVKPGEGYTVTGSDEKLTVADDSTTSAAPPDTKVYDQELPTKGYGYMTTRDGTKLAYYVHPPQDVATALPIGPLVQDLPAAGPFPTLVEYSGYGYANPAGPDSGIAVLANLMGFAVVDVNMRGTGCSGGAFDFFEPLQSIDGYDVVETVARQSWVKGNKVGMMGISYGGISQLFTAQTNPPSLAAIAPFSVIDQTQTTLYPGGVLNTGFAVNWAKERQHEALPSGPKSGQKYAYKRIQEGDETCKSNQDLHPEAANLLHKIRQNDHYRPKVADPLSPLTFVDKIKVPVYMACQFTDEQTGGHCPTLPAAFTGTSKKWFTFTNGTHVDSLAPETFNRWYDFMKIYVANEAPMTGAQVYRATSSIIYDAAMGIGGVTFPPDPIQDEPTYEGAKAAFEKLKPIRVLFDNGAGGEQPGQPVPGFEHSFDALPVPGTVATAWQGKGTHSFTWDRLARGLTNFTGDTGAGDLWTAIPHYKWLQPADDNVVSFTTPELTENQTVVGSGYVQAKVRSQLRRVDLQATVTELRPDGKEVFVQGGWLRADGRKLDKAKSTPLEPVLSLRAKDVQLMPRKRFAKVIIPLYYQGHAYRKGSRIRVLLTAPNGDQPIWSFTTRPRKGKQKVSVRNIRLVLPVVPDADVPTDYPPCPGLRGEPCR